MSEPKLVQCNACGWVHYEVSAAHVRKWEAEWKGYFETKPKEWLEAYGITDKPPSAEDEYCKCFRCRGSYKNFGEAEQAPEGSTIQPILGRAFELKRMEG